jgi:hemerythrin-like domain-containing protein
MRQVTSPESDLDESTRPHAPKHENAARTPSGEASADMLVNVHAHLRSELQQIRSVVAEVVSGQSSPGAARSLINHMSMRQNYWSLGAFCAAYCQVLTMHHTIEDVHLFRGLKSRDAELGPVIDRLSAEHEVIAGVLTQLDQALVAMIRDPEQLALVESVSDAALFARPSLSRQAQKFRCRRESFRSRFPALGVKGPDARREEGPVSLRRPRRGRPDRRGQRVRGARCVRPARQPARRDRRAARLARERGR